MFMSATPRPARLSQPGEVVAILIGSAIASFLLFAGVIVLFATVFIPTVQFGGRGEIPNDFPVYPRSHLESAFATGVGDCTNVSATWSTSDGVEAVTKFYQGELAAGTWRLTDTRDHSGEVDLYFESTSGSHREGSLTLRSGAYQEASTQIFLEMYKSGAKPTKNCRVASTR
jgi:hypothetical protein